MKLKYFYANKVNRFAFYQIPKALFTDKHFQGISSEAKIIYSLLLGRMSISVKNDRTDANGKGCIVYTISKVMEARGCGDKKAVRILKRFDVVGFIPYFVETAKRGTRFLAARAIACDKSEGGWVSACSAFNFPLYLLISHSKKRKTGQQRISFSLIFGSLRFRPFKMVMKCLHSVPLKSGEPTAYLYYFTLNSP